MIRKILYINSRKLEVIVSLQVNSLNTVQTYSKPQVNTAFKANPVVTTNTLERTPTTDILIKPTKNKSKKTLFILGGITLATVAGVLGIRAYRNNYINKAQKTFQEVFMRDNITKEETIALLKRYKKIQKIENKEEYAKAVFEEAKQNFGFKDKPIKLIFKDLSNSEARGGCHLLNDLIETDLKKGSKETLLGHIHHELRHAKQHEIMFNEFPEYAQEKALNKFLRPKAGCEEKAKEAILGKISFEEIFEYPEIAKYYYDDCLGKVSLDEADQKTIQKFKGKIDELLKKYFGELSPENVPSKYKEFARKCKANNMNYINIDIDKKAYRKQFVEDDAYQIENKIHKLLSGIIPV